MNNILLSVIVNSQKHKMVMDLMQNHRQVSSTRVSRSDLSRAAVVVRGVLLVNPLVAGPSYLC